MERLGARSTPWVILRLGRTLTCSLAVAMTLDSPEIWVGILAQERATPGPLERGDGNAESHRVGERLGKMLVAWRDVQHLILADGYCPVPQMDAPRALQHDQKTLRVMAMRL